jgi:hypothetical protein
MFAELVGMLAFHKTSPFFLGAFTFRSTWVFCKQLRGAAKTRCSFPTINDTAAMHVGSWTRKSEGGTGTNKFHQFQTQC